MAIGESNPVLEDRKLYYDLITGEIRFGRGTGKKWNEEAKACVEPAPPIGGPYGRCGEQWVDLGSFVTLAPTL